MGLLLLSADEQESGSWRTATLVLFSSSSVHWCFAAANVSLGYFLLLFLNCVFVVAMVILWFGGLSCLDGESGVFWVLMGRNPGAGGRPHLKCLSLVLLIGAFEAWIHHWGMSQLANFFTATYSYFWFYLYNLFFATQRYANYCLIYMKITRQTKVCCYGCNRSFLLLNNTASHPHKWRHIRSGIFTLPR